MTITRDVLLECDGNGGVCPNVIAHSTAREARKEAHELGWRRRQGLDFCTYCLEHTHRVERTYVAQAERKSLTDGPESEHKPVLNRT